MLRNLAAKMRKKGLLYCLASLWAVCAFAVSIFAAFLHMQIGLNNDNLTLVEQTRKMLHGATPYVDFAEIMPPMIHLLYAFPAAITELSGISIHTSLYGMIMTLIAASLTISWKILRHSKATDSVCWLAASTLALSFLAASFVYQSFAERDHLMLVLIAPWLVLYSPLANRSSVPLSWRMAAAVMAGIGFALKPYFYVFYLASLGFTRWSSGLPLREILRQPEHMTAIAIGTLYLLLIFLFFPAYPFTVVPVGWYTYSAIGWGLADKLNVIRELLSHYGVTGFIAAGVLWFVAPAEWKRALLYLLLLLAACIASYMLNAGWYYTQYPFIALSLVLAVAAGSKLIAWVLQLTPRHMRNGSLALLAIALLSGLYYFHAVPNIHRARWDLRTQKEQGRPVERSTMGAEAWKKVEPYLDRHQKFMFFSTNLWAVNLLKEGTPRENVGRFDFLWPLPGIVNLGSKTEQKAHYEWLANYLAGSIANDIERHSPALVIFDVSFYQRSLPRSYDILGWLMQNAEFAKAWQNYTRVETVQTCTAKKSANCAYTIYYRKDL